MSGAWTLHQLTDELARVGEALAGESDEEREVELSTLQIRLATDVAREAEGVALLADELDRRADAVRAIAREYQVKAARAEVAAAQLREELLSAMDRAGATRIDGERATLSVQMGPWAVDDTEADTDLLPEEYIRTKRELDKRAVRTALDQGRTVPGCRLVRKPTLRVKLGR